MSTSEFVAICSLLILIDLLAFCVGVLVNTDKRTGKRNIWIPFIGGWLRLFRL